MLSGTHEIAPLMPEKIAGLEQHDTEQTPCDTQSSMKGWLKAKKTGPSKAETQSFADRISL